MGAIRQLQKRKTQGKRRKNQLILIQEIERKDGPREKDPNAPPMGKERNKDNTLPGAERALDWIRKIRGNVEEKPKEGYQNEYIIFVFIFVQVFPQYVS